MSKIIHKEHEATDDIRAFTLQEVSSEVLQQHGSVFSMPQVIRDTADIPFAIDDYVLSDATGEPTEENTLPPCEPEPECPTAPDEPDEVVEPEDDWQHEAALLLQQAQEEAECCLAQAQEQAANLKHAAYDEGFKQGEEAARQEITTQCAPLFASLHQALEGLSSVRAEALRLAEQDIITLAFHLAHKIIQQEIRTNRQVLATTLQRALAYLVDCDHVVIRVNPDDLDQARALQPGLLDSGAEDATLMIRGDTSIGRGGCLVDSEFGAIDARIEAQFEELEQRFREHLGQEEQRA